MRTLSETGNQTTQCWVFLHLNVSVIIVKCTLESESKQRVTSWINIDVFSKQRLRGVVSPLKTRIFWCVWTVSNAYIRGKNEGYNRVTLAIMVVMKQPNSDVALQHHFRRLRTAIGCERTHWNSLIQQTVCNRKDENAQATEFFTKERSIIIRKRWR